MHQGVDLELGLLVHQVAGLRQVLVDPLSHPRVQTHLSTQSTTTFTVNTHRGTGTAARSGTTCSLLVTELTDKHHETRQYKCPTLGHQSNLAAHLKLIPQIPEFLAGAFGASFRTGCLWKRIGVFFFSLYIYFKFKCKGTTRRVEYHY